MWLRRVSLRTARFRRFSGSVDPQIMLMSIAKGSSRDISTMRRPGDVGFSLTIGRVLALVDPIVARRTTFGVDRDARTDALKQADLSSGRP